ncbi:MAG: hydrogenase maturation nickel metallochaperone HypA [Desulfomonilia bacterium]|jgi:hydrogenase nickel incorporation protein HypA/HybF
MHEMPIVRKIVKIAEQHALENDARKVTKLVLQIGELSSVIPDAVRLCYPICIEDTLLKDAALEIEVIPAVGKCKGCNEQYNLIEHEYKCPKCESIEWTICSGRELFIKEIAVI